jgi:glutathione S-transferase
MFPVLYSFRRCPYAIRARMALCHCNIRVELREVRLGDKPKEMLAASEKGTVPILVLENQTVLDQSLDIMRWAINQSYPEKSCLNSWSIDTNLELEKLLIKTNDSEFKNSLDGYKYGKSSAPLSKIDYRDKAEKFLEQLEKLLTENKFLLGDNVSLADVSIFPFIRQFAGVDPTWFGNSKYERLASWLSSFIQSNLFLTSMTKYPIWEAGSLGKTYYFN